MDCSSSGFEQSRLGALTPAGTVVNFDKGSTARERTALPGRRGSEPQDRLEGQKASKRLVRISSNGRVWPLEVLISAPHPATDELGGVMSWCEFGGFFFPIMHFFISGPQLLVPLPIHFLGTPWPNHASLPPARQ